LAGLSQKKLVILFSSDELDVDYRNSVQCLVESQHHAITFLDLDALVQQALAQESEWCRTNNFFIYRIICALQELPIIIQPKSNWIIARRINDLLGIGSNHESYENVMSFPAPKPIAYNALTIEWQRSREAATVYK
jgi:hypothetical protein